MDSQNKLLFYENFEHICKSQGTSPYAVTQEAKLGKSSAANWKANGTIPKLDILYRLAEVLSCNVSDFFKTDAEIRESIDMQEALRESSAQIANLSKWIETGEEAQSALLDQALSIDDNVRDFISIYEKCTNRQRNMLMRTVYDFEQQVLSA
ncbi:hypothetical protein [Adlercreutzia sp. ZJ242]|uniref:hypothetical protein n=1 Tax=Adlercreutzia sp. ZJ242 TaxID=2709409 RepID=UPI0013EC3DAA|nr:hypothetical protein [Adlercreutzia sp. ZJ242]